MSNKLRVGITMGDYNGIGPEVIIKTFSDHRILQHCTPIIYGSKKVFSFYCSKLELTDFNYHEIKEAHELNEKKVNLLNHIQIDEEPTPGIQSVLAGKASYDAIVKCSQDLASNELDLILTAPISKEMIQKAGFEFPGHTEYFINMSGESKGLMILVSNILKVALVTGHLPVTQISKHLDKQTIIEKIALLNDSLVKDFMISRPKIAVLGLNPHAGENGKLGSEENEIIIPAIEKSREDNILVFGPYPADAFFGSGHLKSFDAVLAMYHDQGLTGFKTLSFNDGVNFTAGIPVVRTSFDIAGRGCASEDSFRAALFAGIDIYNNRKSNKDLSKNKMSSRTEKSVSNDTA